MSAQSQVRIPITFSPPDGEPRADRTAPTHSQRTIHASRSLWDHVRILLAYRELLILWTQREIKIRYKQSLLGGAWAILQPLALMLTFTTIFSWIVRVPSDGIPYPLFSYTGLLVWTLFSTGVSFAIPTLVNNINLVTKIYFPREIMPLASILAACVDFLVASILLVLMLLWYQTPVTFALLWLPILLLVQLMLIIGVSVPACALNVFYRDVRFVIPLAMQLWMYATPVVYPLSLVPERFRVVYEINPMVGIVEGYRAVLLAGQSPPIEPLVVSSVLSLSLLIAGYAYFKNREPLFADLI